MYLISKRHVELRTPYLDAQQAPLICVYTEYDDHVNRRLWLADSTLIRQRDRDRHARPTCFLTPCNKSVLKSIALFISVGKGFSGMSEGSGTAALPSASPSAAACDHMIQAICQSQDFPFIIHLTASVVLCFPYKVAVVLPTSCCASAAANRLSISIVCHTMPFSSYCWRHK